MRRKQPRLASVEEALYGKEPMPTQGASDEQTSEYLREAMHYYTYAVPAEKKKMWFLEYVGDVADQQSAISHVDDSFFTVAGSLARIWNLGTQQPQHEEKLQEFVTRFYEQGSKIREAKAVKKAAAQKAKDRLREEAMNSFIGKVETFLDEICQGEKKGAEITKFLESLKTSPEEQELLVKKFEPLHKELTSVESDFIEAYEYLGKKKKSVTDFVQGLLQKEATVAQRVVRRPRKTRKPRAVNPVKAVARLQFCPEAKIGEKTVKSVQPTKLVGASEVWVYNTKYRLLSKYVAASGGLMIKGTSLKNFNEANSKTKKLRKPEETVTSVLNEGKVVLRKLMDTLTTKESKTTGRLNRDVLILRVVA